MDLEGYKMLKKFLIFTISLFLMFFLLNPVWGLTETEARAIMANISAVISIQNQKAVKPTPPAPKPDEDEDSGSCPNGQCGKPQEQTQEQTQQTYQPSRFRLFR